MTSMTATHVEPELPGMLTADNILISGDMSTYWNAQSYPNPRNRFTVITTPDGSRLTHHTETGAL